MGITDETVAEVRAKSDIVHIAQNFMQLKKVGRRYTGLCPFHGEKTPSFSVNAEDGLYYCFGCQAKGDTITLVRELQHLDFAEAIEWLASQCGVQVRYTERGQGERRERKAHLHAALERAVAWYHDRLLTGRDAGAARAYLRQRGFDGESVRRYRLGWAPDDWDQ
ncbi:MAG TPA: CHC2 zinc finger domain-containing protein, partial [Iamia sp.]|nr:CHC2 zinc finger domain-containing protein [Iamia sp.]